MGIKIMYGVVQMKIYDTDNEYRMAAEIQSLRKENAKCEKAFLFVSACLIIVVLSYIFICKG
jgi:hypothetical protein